VSALVDFFADARLLLGAHGGCMTNLLFMPCGSSVVELFPLDLGGMNTPVGHNAMLMYLQSTMLEHDYWMVPIRSPHGNGDFTAPLDQVERILVDILGPPPGA